jgi:hypothetical protein
MEVTSEQEIDRALFEAYDRFVCRDIGVSDLRIPLDEFGQFASSHIRAMSQVLNAFKGPEQNVQEELTKGRNALSNCVKSECPVVRELTNHALAWVNEREETGGESENNFDWIVWKLFQLRLRRAQAQLKLCTEGNIRSNDVKKALGKAEEYVKTIQGKYSLEDFMDDPLLLKVENCRNVKKWLFGRPRNPRCHLCHSSRAEIFAYPCSCPCSCRDCWVDRVPKTCPICGKEITEFVMIRRDGDDE